MFENFEQVEVFISIDLAFQIRYVKFLLLAPISIGKDRNEAPERLGRIVQPGLHFFNTKWDVEEMMYRLYCCWKTCSISVINHRR